MLVKFKYNIGVLSSVCVTRLRAAVEQAGRRIDADIIPAEFIYTAKQKKDAA